MSLCQMAGLVSALVTLTILLKMGHLLEQLPRVKLTQDSKNVLSSEKHNMYHMLHTTF